MTELLVPIDRGPGGRYLFGLLGVVVAGAAGILGLPPAWGPSLWLALGVAVAMQAPLGAWLVTSVGTDRFLAAWALGMLARAALVGVMALVVFPALGWPAAPGLIGLVVFLMASVSVEALALLRRSSRIEVR